MRLFNGILASTVACFAVCAASAATLEEAKQKFAQREFTEAGIEAATEAVNIAREVVKQSSTTEAKLFLSKAIYFVGSAVTDTDTKLAKFSEGILVAQEVLMQKFSLDVTKFSSGEAKALDETRQKATDLKGQANIDLAVLSEALYLRAINLGGWGQAKGVSGALGRWPELRNSLFMAKFIDENAENFGASRVLGRAYFALPTVAGGDLNKSGENLEAAYENTLHNTLGISISATTNVYYSEYLNKVGQRPLAVALLTKLANADVRVLDPESVPETLQQVTKARRLLDEWR